jgi:hypothetical protein
MRLKGIFLLFLHAFPIIEAIQVVEEKGKETNDHREIGKGVYAGENPKQY